MNLVRHLDESLWRDFVKRNPHGNIFHTPEMFQVFANAEGYWPNLWAVVDDNNYPLALFVPLTITLMGGLLKKFTARAVAYGSVLCTSGAEGQDALNILLRTYKQETDEKILFTELRNLTNLGNLHPVLSENGFTYEEHLNYLVELNQPISQVLQNIGKRTRKKIRKGLKDGLVKINEVTDRVELNVWYEVLKKTYSYAQVPLAGYSLFEAAFDHLYPQNMAEFFLAWINDSPVACSLELPYKNTIYGWYGGTNREYSEYYPNEMLIWHVLERGVRHGYKVYDFGGAGKPDEKYGVRDFKAKFGGQLVCYGRYTYVHSPTRLKVSKLAYKLLRWVL
ncbi:MAG: GNAT family N-acetyltransferase [Anaerolineae bacterium]|nr:GNAT family N-acetyltransferase [Anaerolineae bacterium]